MIKKYIISRADGLEKMNDYRSGHQIVVAQGGDLMEVFDGYHTMDELYEHRITLFIALCRAVHPRGVYGGPDEKYWCWRSKKHHDGELCFGTGTQFVLGIGTEAGKMITYHIPIEHWDETGFAETIEVAPEWDGHTSDDVLERLKNL